MNTPVLKVSPALLIVTRLEKLLVVLNWNDPFAVPPMPTSKYMVLVTLEKSRIAIFAPLDAFGDSILRATLLNALPVATNAFAALLVTPKRVPTDVMFGCAAVVTVPDVAAFKFAT